MGPYGNIEKVLRRTLDILNSGKSDIPEIKVEDLYGNTEKLIYNLCQSIIEGGGGSKDIIPLLSITTEYIGEFSIDSKYYNNTNKKIYTSTIENSWDNAIIEDPEYNIFYIYNNKIYIWDGNNLVLSFNYNYNDLSNKPSINDIVLEGNKDVFELGIIKNVNFIVKGDVIDLPEVQPPQTALLINKDTCNGVFYKTKVGENTWVIDEEANSKKHLGQIVIGVNNTPNCVICYRYTYSPFGGSYFYDNKPNEIIPSQLDQNYLMTRINFPNCYLFYSWIDEEIGNIVYTTTTEDGPINVYYTKINSESIADILFNANYADNISISNNVLQVGTKYYNRYNEDHYGYINSDFPSNFNFNNKLIYASVLLNNYYNSKTIDEKLKNLGPTPTHTIYEITISPNSLFMNSLTVGQALFIPITQIGNDMAGIAIISFSFQTTAQIPAGSIIASMTISGYNLVAWGDFVSFANSSSSRYACPIQVTGNSNSIYTKDVSIGGIVWASLVFMAKCQMAP